jgi:hypothetical protein
MLGGALRELKIKIIAPLTSELRAQPLPLPHRGYAATTPPPQPLLLKPGLQSLKRATHYYSACVRGATYFCINLTLISMREGTFHPLSFLDQNLSAEFLLKIF